MRLLAHEVDHRSKNLLMLVQASGTFLESRPPRRNQGGNRGAHSGALACPYAARTIALGRGRPAQSD